MTGIVRHWKGRAVPRQNQLLEHLGNGKSFDSVAQAWDAAMADAKAEDTVLVCGSFHTVAHVMEVIDARRSGGK